MTIREGSELLDRAIVLFEVQCKPSCLLTRSPKRPFVFKCAASKPDTMKFVSDTGTSKACEKVLQNHGMPVCQRQRKCVKPCSGLGPS